MQHVRNMVGTVGPRPAARHRLAMRHLLALARPIISTTAAPCSRCTVTGEVTHVRDGDTTVVGTMPIRLDGLAPPEWNELGGRAGPCSSWSTAGRSGASLDGGLGSYGSQAEEAAVHDPLITNAQVEDLDLSYTGTTAMAIVPLPLPPGAAARALLHHLLEQGNLVGRDAAGRTIIELTVDDWVLEKLMTFDADAADLEHGGDDEHDVGDEEDGPPVVLDFLRPKMVERPRAVSSRD